MAGASLPRSQPHGVGPAGLSAIDLAPVAVSDGYDASDGVVDNLQNKYNSKYVMNYLLPICDVTERATS